MDVRTRRAYDPISPDDGWRVLVDRLWPRGIKKVDLHPDQWAKELAPSTALRKAFGHVPGRFDDFRARYLDELNASPEAARVADELATHPIVTLLYAARDREHNEAVVLRDWLQHRQSTPH